MQFHFSLYLRCLKKIELAEEASRFPYQKKITKRTPHFANQGSEGF